MNLCLVLLDTDDLRRTTLCAFTASDAPFRVDNRSRREQLGSFLHRRSKKGWKVAGKIHRFGLRVDKVGNGQRQRIGIEHPKPGRVVWAQAAADAVEYGGRLLRL